VKAIPDRFSRLMDYLSAFRLPLLEEMRAEMSANLADSLSSSSHFPVAKIQALPVRKDESGVQTSPSRYRLTVARGRRGARNFPCPGDVVLLSDATSPCRRPADLMRDGRACCLAHVEYVEYSALTFWMVASERIDQATRCYPFGVSLIGLIPYSRIWRCLDYAATVERNPALVREVAGDGDGADTHDMVNALHACVFIFLLHELRFCPHLFVHRASKSPLAEHVVAGFPASPRGHRRWRRRAGGQVITVQAQRRTG